MDAMQWDRWRKYLLHTALPVRQQWPTNVTYVFNPITGNSLQLPSTNRPPCTFMNPWYLGIMLGSLYRCTAASAEAASTPSRSPVATTQPRLPSILPPARRPTPHATGSATAHLPPPWAFNHPACSQRLIYRRSSSFSYQTRGAAVQPLPSSA